MNEDGKNYGDFLLKTIDGIKDQFSADELKLLNEGAEEIKEIEGKLTLLEQKFPGCGEKPSDGDMSVPAENGKPIEKDDLKKFPTFDGKDLDGNEVKSSTLLQKYRYCSKLLVYHLQSLRGRTCRPGSSE